MAKSSNRGRGSRNDNLHVMELARERPFAAAAAAAGAAAAGLFLWSKRTQISDQLSHLNEQIGEWRESMRSNGELEAAETASRPNAKGRRSTGMSETGAGNASLGARSGGGMRSSASGRGRAQSASIQ